MGLVPLTGEESEMGDWLFDNLGWIVGAFLILLVGFIVSVFVAHANGIQAGYVYDKDYSGPRSWVDYHTTVAGKTTVTIPVQRHTNESFTLRIRQMNDSKGEYDTNYFDVPESIWTAAKLGDYFDSRCMCITQGE
jgi:hypothetical protein